MTALPFIPEQSYKRSEIHDRFGGNRQSGICPSTSYPYIFIFSGKTGKQYGYEDGWDNENVFSYTGEGQVGDMDFVRGNLALHDHLNNGKRVFLFEYLRTGYVKFVAELEIIDLDYFETPDINGDERLGIKFFFKRVGAIIPSTYNQITNLSKAAEETIDYGYDYKTPEKSERSSSIITRVGQNVYRKRIIHRWDYKCAVTGFEKLSVLRASHIVAWKDSTEEERHDVNNGILLSPDFDALFDKHLISFEDSGKIILSSSIELNAYQLLGITGQEKVKHFSNENKDYLERHRAVFK
ncbi:MAG: HNH endonuclease [Vicingaceae bacterium]